MHDNIIIISSQQWSLLQKQLTKDYGRAVALLNNERQKTLGMITKTWAKYDSKNNQFFQEVALIFNNEYLKTMFLIKYGNIIL